MTFCPSTSSHFDFYLFDLLPLDFSVVDFLPVGFTSVGFLSVYHLPFDFLPWNQKNTLSNIHAAGRGKWGMTGRVGKTGTSPAA